MHQKSFDGQAQLRRTAEYSAPPAPSRIYGRGEERREKERGKRIAGEISPTVIFKSRCLCFQLHSVLLIRLSHPGFSTAFGMTV